VHKLELTNITKRYRGATVVDNLSITVQSGRVTGFLGPNGAGKSTTMKILLGLVSPDKGEALIGGRRYRDFDKPTRMVGAILESDAFHPGRSGRNHLLILADAAGILHERIEDLLRLVELEDAADRKVGGYSLGMRQRLGIAVALLGDPPILVLDEPGNGLDPAGMRWLRDLLKTRAASGNTIFVSSHLLAEMEHLADDLIVIQKGRLVRTGTIAELLTAASSVSVRTPSAADLIAVLEAAGGVIKVQDEESFLVRNLLAAEIGARALSAGIELHELAAKSSSLEELFLTWTGSTHPQLSEHMIKEGAMV